MLIERICLTCNISFQIENNRIKHGRGKFCSVECKNKGTPKRSTVKLECAVCKKIFERSKSQIRSKHHFCSRGCAYKGRSIGFVKRTITKQYNIKVKKKKKCLICDTFFIPKKKTQKYCSRKCFEIAHRENMRGSKNPSYIDGRRKERRCYRGANWKWIRLRVFKRDNWICQLCGKICNDRDTHAHHIVKYKKTRDNSLKNLVTLHTSCHNKVENDPELLFEKRPDLRYFEHKQILTLETFILS